jgi:hypothetical protein
LNAEEYLRRSDLFRRLKNGPHGQIVELYAARLVKAELAGVSTRRRLKLVADLFRVSSRATVCSRSLRRCKMSDYAGWKQDDDRSTSGKSARTRCLPETIRHNPPVGITCTMLRPA